MTCSLDVVLNKLQNFFFYNKIDCIKHAFVAKSKMCKFRFRMPIPFFCPFFRFRGKSLALGISIQIKL